MTSRAARPIATTTRTRRRARTLLAAAGTLNLLSAMTPPIAARLAFLDPILPLNARESAAATAALSGILLLVLASGLRRGARRAWTASLVVLAATVLANVTKGLDLEEATASMLLAAYLAVHHDAFRSSTDPAITRRATRAFARTCLGIAALAAAIVAVTASRHRPLHLRAIASTMRAAMFGQHPLGSPAAQTALVLVALIAAVGAAAGLWALLRPAHMTPTTSEERARARVIVDRYSSGTLDYFALRDDKHHWIHGNTVVAYRVFNGVCLVSPDPIGPMTERREAWRAFQRHADSHGWSTAVLGAAPEWLPTYRDGGLHAFYLGDEAIVDLTTFRLDGGRFKGLRQAVNRVARHGYTLDLTDPTTLDPATQEQLHDLATESRRGAKERGFSMTLGRLFDPADHGLLIAIVRDQTSRPVAFCQFVPAPAIGGYSLDLMRRSRGDHPNGLLDFLLVGTIGALAERGATRLSLNFAAMRAVLAADDSRPSRRAVRTLIGRLTHSLQVESLWRFNAKYDPDWSPRYLLYDAHDRLAPVGLAALRAEQPINDLCVVGRILAHTTPTP